MTKRGVIPMAFALGSIGLALVLDAGRLSWLVAVVGNIVAMYVDHREFERLEDGRRDDNPARMTGARWYVGFVVISAGGLLSVAFYPGWHAYAVIAVFGFAAMAMRPFLLMKPPSSPG
jgi:hypothetical protein